MTITRAAVAATIMTFTSISASADDRWPAPDRAPASEIRVVPPDVPPSTKLEVTIDDVTIERSRLEAPIPVAPGARRIRYSAAERDRLAAIWTNEVEVERGRSTTVAPPQLVKRADGVGMGLGIGLAILGAGSIGASIWALYDINRARPESEPTSEDDEGEGDYSALFSLVGGFALVLSVGMTSGGIALSALSAEPRWEWDEPPPKAAGARVHGLAVTVAF